MDNEITHNNKKMNLTNSKKEGEADRKDRKIKKIY